MAAAAAFCGYSGSYAAVWPPRPLHLACRRCFRDGVNRGSRRYGIWKAFPFLQQINEREHFLLSSELLGLGRQTNRDCVQLMFLERACECTCRKWTSRRWNARAGVGRQALHQRSLRRRNLSCRKPPTPHAATAAPPAASPPGRRAPGPAVAGPRVPRSGCTPRHTPPSSPIKARPSNPQSPAHTGT